jgi:hypothetical protein
MSEHASGCLEDARELWERRVCLEPVSKNLRGELKLLDRERQECEEPRCLTLKTDHLLRLEVESHEPCDSEVGRLLDGTLVVRRLVHALANGTGEGRGLHTGEFRWAGNGVRVAGRLSGMTNVGTHRQPPFDPCQECRAPGWMEGRLCGRIVRAEDRRLVGCQVTAAYRLRFDPSEGFQDTGIRGTLEGLVVCSCATGKCLDFTGFPEGSHANPWSVGGHVFQVVDNNGLPTATADIVTMGGFTGLHARSQTKIVLGAPAAAVDITLVTFSAAVTVTAFDATATAVDSATTVTSGAAETLHLTGPGITTLLVDAPQDETLILELCVS